MIALNLEAVFFLPSGAHPLKDTDRLAPVAHRVAMTRLAIQDQDGFELCALDATSEGVSYTIDTLHTLVQRFPLGELVLLVGTDLLAELHLWKNWQAILEVAHLCPLVRAGYETVSMAPSVAQHLEAFRVQSPDALDRGRLGHFGYCPLPVTALDIQATHLRQRISCGESIRYLTPDAVLAYIQQHGLYERDDCPRYG